MKTTNFAIARTLTHNNIVSIALKSASEFHGREYKKLAPPWWILNAYRENSDKKQYIRNYQKYVLDCVHTIESMVIAKRIKPANMISSLS